MKLCNTAERVLQAKVNQSELIHLQKLLDAFIDQAERSTCSRSGDLACSITEALYILIISVVCLLEFVFKEIQFHEVIYL